MSSKTGFTVGCAIVCDDHRFENNGKGIIIGVYGDRIGFFERPRGFSFCVCLVGSARNHFGIEMKAEFMPEEGDQGSEFQIGADLRRQDMEEGKPYSWFIPVKGVTLPIDGPGKLLIKTRQKGGKAWKLISETKIEVNPNPSTEQPQLS